MPVRVVKNPGSRGGLSPEERLIYKRELSRKWRAENREKHRDYQRNYRIEHLEECYVRNRKWAIDNPERINEINRISRRNHPARYADNTKRYRQSHPEKQLQFNQTNRARRRGAPGSLSDVEWIFIVTCFSGHCGKCGSTERLSIDHIIPVSKGGHHSMDNVQPLCVSCNSGKYIRTIDYRLSSIWFNREMYEQGV